MEVMRILLHQKWRRSWQMISKVFCPLVCLLFFESPCKKCYWSQVFPTSFFEIWCHPYFYRQLTKTYLPKCTECISKEKENWYFVTKIVLVIEKSFWNSRLKARICKIFEITRIIYSNNERSDQLLVTCRKN